MEFSGHIPLNSENMPQLVRPILLACIKINVEESDFFCPPEFHFHLFSSIVVAGTGRRSVCISLEQTCCVSLKTFAGPSRLHPNENIFSGAVLKHHPRLNSPQVRNLSSNDASGWQSVRISKRWRRGAWLQTTGLRNTPFETSLKDTE